jgi:hypothetical protein
MTLTFPASKNVYRPGSSVGARNEVVPFSRKKVEQLINSKTFSEDPKQNKLIKDEVFAQLTHKSELPRWLNLVNVGFAALPAALLMQLVACSFATGISQAAQEFNMQFVSKGIINGLLIRQSPPALVDEMALEFPEYFAIYFLPTLTALAASYHFANVAKLPHNELMGMRMYDLEKQLGKSVEVGVVNKKRVLIDQLLLNRMYATKFLSFLTAGAMLGTAELFVPALRVFITKALFGTTNFYKISGLPVDDSEVNDGDQALEQGKKNIILGLTLMAMLGLGLTGAATLINRRSSPMVNPFVRRMSKMFDVDNKFGLTKSLISIGMIVAIYSYTSVARNMAEVKEIINRIILFSIPAVLFYKQLFGNLSVWLFSRFSGVKGMISPVSSYFEEAWGKEHGKRDIFDLNLVDLHQNEKGFDGRVTELPDILKMYREDPAKCERFLKRVTFLKGKAPIWAALIIGILINFGNFLSTKSLQEQEGKTKKDDPNQDDQYGKPLKPSR